MTSPAEQAIRYEPDEACPVPVAVVVGLQGAVLGLAPLVLFGPLNKVKGGTQTMMLTVPWPERDSKSSTARRYAILKSPSCWRRM